MKVYLMISVRIAEVEKLKEEITAALLRHSEGPWDVLLAPHDVRRSLWRLRLSCPGSVTVVTLARHEQNPQGVMLRVRDMLAYPMNCHEQQSA